MELKDAINKRRSLRAFEPIEITDKMIKEISIQEAIDIHNTIPEFHKKHLNDFEDRIKDKQSLVIGAFSENISAGYIIAYKKYEDGSLYCWMAGVNPNFRKQGILKEMMDYITSWAKDKGFTKIRIKTRNSRREMLSYLIKYHYDIVEFTPHPEDNRIVFEKKIYN